MFLQSERKGLFTSVDSTVDVKFCRKRNKLPQFRYTEKSIVSENEKARMNIKRQTVSSYI
jgi:hypothetical protein